MLVHHLFTRHEAHFQNIAIAQSAISYERVSLYTPLEDENQFRGEPREELDKAWQSYTKCWSSLRQKLTPHPNQMSDTHLRVSEAELRNANRTGVSLNDEKGGYLATIDVFHELHCLNVIREQVYRQHYPTKHSVRDQLMHTDHCIDTLRQTLMCHGDDALVSFFWKPDHRWPWPNFAIDHECRNWDALLEWAETRRIPSVKGPIIKHPTLGRFLTGKRFD